MFAQESPLWLVPADLRKNKRKEHGGDLYHGLVFFDSQTTSGVKTLGTRAFSNRAGCFRAQGFINGFALTRPVGCWCNCPYLRIDMFQNMELGVD